MSDLANDRNEVVYKGFTWGRLSDVFDLVCPIGNWKYPIESHIDVALASMDEIIAAVEFFAGGTPTVIRHGSDWGVTGAGYYEWVGS